MVLLVVLVVGGGRGGCGGGSIDGHIPFLLFGPVFFTNFVFFAASAFPFCFLNNFCFAVSAFPLFSSLHSFFFFSCFFLSICVFVWSIFLRFLVYRPAQAPPPPHT